MEIRRLKKGKIITSISLDNNSDLIEHCEKQKNFSAYVQKLIEQDMAILKQAEKETDKIEVELTPVEMGIYIFCLPYFREYGYMKYGDNFEYLQLQPEPETLHILLSDVRDNLKEEIETDEEILSLQKGKIITISPETVKEMYDYVLELKKEDEQWKHFYNKISRYWRQENPMPEEWKKEVVLGLTIHEALAKILPEVQRRKHKSEEFGVKATLTTKMIADLTDLTYQIAYTKLLPHIHSILRKEGIEI